MNDVTQLTIAEASARIRGRQLSPVELVEASLARISRFDRHVRSFITLTADLALEAAKAAERDIGNGRYRGPLHGIPFGLKDVIDTAGIRTTGNSRVYERRVPKRDATVAAKLAEAGAILIGKQTAHELAHGGPSHDLPWPPARNPWNLEHFTGGSSSGSAAGVAARFVYGALGTDTGGSIRSPASLCGIVGLKPTYGLVSRAGVIPHSFSLDHVGPMTRTVEDTAIVLQAIAGHDPLDAASADRPVPDYYRNLGHSVRGLRVGVLSHLWEKDLPASGEVMAATTSAISVLKGLGMEVDVASVRAPRDYSDVKAIVCECEAFAVQSRELVARSQDYGFDYLVQILLACLFQGSDYVRAQRQRRLLSEEFAPLYDKYDVLLTAGLGPAPRLDAQCAKGAINKWKDANLTGIFNVTGGPAIMVSSGFSASGLPLGLQLAGRPFEEATLLRVAHAYERETAWTQKAPLLDGAAREPGTRNDVHVGAQAPDPAMLDLVKTLTRSAGITASERVLEEVARGAPYALAMVRRLPAHSFALEPANVFRP